MANLFAYGSLMYSDVIRIVLNRAIDDLEIRDAVLDGYRRIAVPERPYPTGIAQPGSQIRGKIITGLSGKDIQRLDAYEESFYVRQTVTVQTERGMAEAFVYIDSRSPLPFAAEEWDAKRFEKDHLAAFAEKLEQKWRASDRIR